MLRRVGTLKTYSSLAVFVTVTRMLSDGCALPSGDAAHSGGPASCGEIGHRHLSWLRVWTHREPRRNAAQCFW